MKKFILGLSVLTLFLLAPLSYGDDNIYLATWGFNFNGIVQAGNNPDVPGSPPDGWTANYAGFDFNTGLGKIDFGFSGVPGAYFFVVFFDHDLGPFPLDSNTGAAFGVLGEGQSWQLGPPGYPGDGGDTFYMFEANTLKNLNEIEPGEYADVSAALGWNFILGSPNSMGFEITVSTDVPNSAFYLQEFDAVTGTTIYISGVQMLPVPEPDKILLMASGLLGAANWLRRRRG